MERKRLLLPEDIKDELEEIDLKAEDQEYNGISFKIKNHCKMLIFLLSMGQSKRSFRARTVEKIVCGEDGKDALRTAHNLINRFKDCGNNGYGSLIFEDKHKKGGDKFRVPESSLEIIEGIFIQQPELFDRYREIKGLPLRRKET